MCDSVLFMYYLLMAKEHIIVCKSRYLVKLFSFILCHVSYLAVPSFRCVDCMLIFSIVIIIFIFAEVLYFVMLVSVLHFILK